MEERSCQRIFLKPDSLVPQPHLGISKTGLKNQVETLLSLFCCFYSFSRIHKPPSPVQSSGVPSSACQMRKVVFSMTLRFENVLASKKIGIYLGPDKQLKDEIYAGVQKCQSTPGFLNVYIKWTGLRQAISLACVWGKWGMGLGGLWLLGTFHLRVIRNWWEVED